MKRLARSATALLALATIACASAATQSASSGTSNPDVLAYSELRELDQSYGSMYQVISDYRPEWLDPRGQVSLVANPNAHLPMVFVEGTERGLPETLRNIPVTDIERAEFLDAGEATNRYGRGYPGGVIELTLRGGP